MVSFEDFKKLDIRIARIADVREHPNADKLYVIQIDLGDRTKQIVAGIRANYSSADLVGKKIVVVDNLEPVTLRGEESHGMLLAACDKNGPVVLVPESDVPPGTQIS